MAGRGAADKQVTAMLADFEQVTLLPRSLDAPVRPGAILGFMPLPVVASHESRADSALRRSAEQVASALPLAAWAEVRAEWRVDGASEVRPAILLLDRDSAVLTCLHELGATLLLHVAEDGVSMHHRYRDLRRFVDALVDVGYGPRLCHVSGKPDDGADASVAAWLKDVEARRARRDLAIDVAIVFAVAWALVAGGLAWRVGVARPILLLVVSAVLASVPAAYTVFYAWLETSRRVREFQAELAAWASESPAPTFRAPSSRWTVVSAVVVFGGFALVGLTSGELAVAAFLALVLAASLAYTAALHHGWATTDAHGVEGLGWRGRDRIPYGAIDRIPAIGELEPCLVRGGGRRLWLSKHLQGHQRLLDVLWKRVLAVHDDPDPTVVQMSARAMLDGVQQSLDRARQFGQLRRYGRSMPLGYRLLRTHPVRGQYAAQRHLLEHGRVVGARVVQAADIRLFEAPRRNTPAITDARVVFAAPSQAADAAHALDRLNSVSFDDDASDTPSPEVARFREALTLQRARIRPLPASLLGDGLFAARVIIDARALPLGYLRSSWLPVLADRTGCDYVMVVPVELWPPDVRRAWLAGAPRHVGGEAAPDSEAPSAYQPTA